MLISLIDAGEVCNSSFVLAASQYATEVAHSEMYAAASGQRNQQGTDMSRISRPIAPPGQHTPGPTPPSSCTGTLKPGNIGVPLQPPGVSHPRVSH